MKEVSIEQIIKKVRDGLGTTEESLRKARDRMVESNKRLGKQWEAQQVTEEILSKRCTL